MPHLGIIALLHVVHASERESHVGFGTDADDDARNTGKEGCARRAVDAVRGTNGFQRLADLIMLMHSGLSIDNCIGDRGCGEFEWRSAYGSGSRE